MGGKQIVLILDGNNLLYRAFYAIPRLTAPDGSPSGAVYGFVNMMGKVRERFNPAYMCVVFDTPAPTFRDEIYEGYKVTRQKMPEDLAVQLPVVKQIIDLAGIKRIEVQGVEADDVIGSLARDGEERDLEVVIVSSDKDLCQIVSGKITMYDSMKRITYDPEGVEKKYGVEPGKIVDLLSLAGDTSDNIPGVRGVGEKTALSLLKEFGSVDNLIKNLEFIKGKRGGLLREQVESIKISRLLARIITDVPLPLSLEDLSPQTPRWGELKGLFRKFGFRESMGIGHEEEGQEREKGPILEFEKVSSKEGFGKLLEKSKGSVLSASLQKSGEEKVLGIATSGGIYVASGSSLGEIPIPPEDFMGPIVFHDMKNAVRQAPGLEVCFDYPYEDTMLAAYLLHPEESNFSLERIVIRYASYNIPRSIEGIEEVAAAHAEGVRSIISPLEERLKETGLGSLYREMEIPLIRVLYQMEKRGIGLDQKVLLGLSGRIGRDLEEIEGRVSEFSGREVNLASPKQVSSLLFETLGLTPVKRTKTGYSTDMDVLDQLKGDHAVPGLIIEHRGLSKLKSTYVDVLPSMVDPESGRIHTRFNQMQTSTGRLSSSNPNLQNIPVRSELGKEIRDAFVPDKGYRFVGGDYSQIEIRVLAHLSQDETLKSVFEAGRDVHTETAMAIFRVAEDEVTPEYRRRAKIINFGILYGMTPFGLSRELGITQGEARTYIDDYFSRFPGVQGFMEKTLKSAREKGYVETLSGRRRYIRDIDSRNQGLRQAAERMAMNAPVQGSAADIIKLSMVKLWNLLSHKGMDAYMVLQVHDELILESAMAVASESAEILRSAMEEIVSLDVPLKVDLKMGDSWGNMREFK